MALVTIALDLERLVVEQIGRRPPGQAHGAERPRGIEVAIGGVARQLAGRVHQHDDRKLEPLGLVDGHQAHAVAAVLEDRRLGRLGPLGRLAQRRDEAAKRQPAVGFVAPAQIGDVQHVGQGLLAARAASAKATCARVAVSRSFSVSATGRELRRWWRSRSSVSASPTGCRCAARWLGTWYGWNRPK